jgi:hypothetical protein
VKQQVFNRSLSNRARPRSGVSKALPRVLCLLHNAGRNACKITYNEFASVGVSALKNSDMGYEVGM